VNYDKHNWKLLSQHLIAYGSQLPKETRTKLLQDALILAAGGELDYALALDMTLFLFNENEISVWAFMINHVENIEKFYRSTSVEYKFNVSHNICEQLYIYTSVTLKFYYMSSCYMCISCCTDHITFFSERLRVYLYQMEHSSRTRLLT